MKNIIKNNKLYLVVIFIFILVLIYVLNLNNQPVQATTNEDIISNQKNEININEQLFAEIKGAINNPGVYEFQKNNRVIDLITLAGGLKDDANIDYINLSKKLTDEMVIKIYTNQEIEDNKKVEVITEYVEIPCNCPQIENDDCITTNSSISDNLIDINTCTKDQLLTIPNIGESKALKIIQYRDEKGLFNNIEDIKNVSGIGDSLYEKIKNYIKV